MASVLSLILLVVIVASIVALLRTLSSMQEGDNEAEKVRAHEQWLGEVTHSVLRNRRERPVGFVPGANAAGLTQGTNDSHAYGWVDAPLPLSVVHTAPTGVDGRMINPADPFFATGDLS